MDTVTDEMLAAVKAALGISADAYDAEISDLVQAGAMDLKLATGMDADETDPLVRQAIKTFVRMSFRSPADYDRLRMSYESQKGQLQIATGYTDWGDQNG